MKVLIIAPKILNPYLGPSVVVHNTLKGFLKINDELKKNDVEITFLSLNDIESRDFGNIKVFASRRHPSVTFTGDIQALFRKPKSQFDVVHTHDLYEIFPWLFAKAAKLYTLHGIVWKGRNYEGGLGKLWTGLYEVRLRLYYHRLDKFVAISQYVKDELKAKGFDISKAVIIENPVSDEFFDIDKKDDNLILYPAMLSPRKNQLGFLKALLLIKDDVKSFKIVFTGSGSAEYIQSLRRFVKKERLNVDFTGKIPYEKLLELYSKASIIVVTSFDETFGMAVAEGMATGTPVLASSIPVFKENLKDGTNGLLADPNNPIEIAEKLLMLINDERLRRKIGKNGKKEAERRWRSEVIAGKLLDLYLHVA